MRKATRRWPPRREPEGTRVYFGARGLAKLVELLLASLDAFLASEDRATTPSLLSEMLVRHTFESESTRLSTLAPYTAPKFTPTLRIYDLRHTCITLWLKAGVQADVASKLASHATAAFALTPCAHALSAQELEAAEKMDAMFGTA